MNLKKPFTHKPPKRDETVESTVSQTTAATAPRCRRAMAWGLALALTVPVMLPVAAAIGRGGERDTFLSADSPVDQVLDLTTDRVADPADTQDPTETIAEILLGGVVPETQPASDPETAPDETTPAEVDTEAPIETMPPSFILEAKPAEPPTAETLVQNGVLASPPPDTGTGAPQPDGLPGGTDELIGPPSDGVGSSDDTDISDGEIDPAAPLTQEAIARSLEKDMDLTVRSGSRVRFPFPAGSMAVDLQKDGRRVLQGQVVDIGGTVYVPVQRFADLFGSFKTVYTAATEQVVITGKNLSITVRAGDPYITVNERIFYTGQNVLSLRGWIFVPLTSMSRAVGATVTIRSNYYDAKVTSGDPTAVAWASDYYDSTDLYWLSRIISAEARGEPFRGQIAVGNVVLNRVRSREFPNTVKGVIFDRKYGVQFSPVSSGTIYNTPTSSAVMAAKICLEGYSLSTRMLYFYNPAIATSSWIGNTRPYIMTIGSHKFYG